MGGKVKVVLLFFNFCGCASYSYLTLVHSYRPAGFWCPHLTYLLSSLQTVERRRALPCPVLLWMLRLIPDQPPAAAPAPLCHPYLLSTPVAHDRPLFPPQHVRVIIKSILKEFLSFFQLVFLFPLQSLFLFTNQSCRQAGVVTTLSRVYFDFSSCWFSVFPQWPMGIIIPHQHWMQCHLHHSVTAMDRPLPLPHRWLTSSCQPPVGHASWASWNVSWPHCSSLATTFLLRLETASEA